MQIENRWVSIVAILLCGLAGSTSLLAQGTPAPNQYYKLFNKAGAQQNLVLDRTRTTNSWEIVVSDDTRTNGNFFGPDPSVNGYLKSGNVDLDNGIPLQLFGGPGTTIKDHGVNQHWKLIDLGGGDFGLQSRENPLFWVNGVPCPPGFTHCKVQVWDSGSTLSPGDNGVWRLEDAGNGFFRIRQKKSGLLINADGPNVSQGSRIQLYGQTGGDNELWQFVMLK
jgi:hypothetical protein